MPEDTEESEVIYCVHSEEFHPEWNCDNYYSPESQGKEIIQSDSIEKLYEAMAEKVIRCTLGGEKEIENGWCDSRAKIEQFEVKFSDIYILVGEYDEARMKATSTYQRLGAEREAKHIRDKAIAEAKQKRDEENRAKLVEAQERAEFARLAKKFGAQ